MARFELDYDLATPNMLLHYFPTGILGLGLTALLASFMSGMAGNVTAFNTVWTYDIYQSYINKKASDEHYLWMGRMATIFGIALSVAAAYMATRFNNIMDMLQLVFAFVNAPLFATFLLGMFWKRTTGHGAFTGLLGGTIAAALHHGLTLPQGGVPGVKGGWIAIMHVYPSEMAQNFWTAIYAWTTCFVITIVVSLLTRASRREGIGGPGVLAHRTPDAARSALVSTARGAGGCGAGGHCFAEYYFPIGEKMGLDIRLPIGFLFSIFGVLLIAFGALSDKAIYERSLGININLEWGVVMLVFGAIMLVLGRPGTKSLDTRLRTTRFHVPAVKSFSVRTPRHRMDARIRSVSGQSMEVRHAAACAVARPAASVCQPAVLRPNRAAGSAPHDGDCLVSGTMARVAMGRRPRR